MQGIAPQVVQQNNIFKTPGVVALSIASAAPTVSTGTRITPSVGALTLAGIAPDVTDGLVVRPDSGALSLLGHAPSEVIGLVRQPASGAISLTGHAPIVNSPNWVIIDTTQTPEWEEIVTG